MVNRWHSWCCQRLWAVSWFRSPQGQARIYITGDTLVFADIEEIPRRYQDIHLALLHLGGTRVLGVLVTMDDAQGVAMLQIVKPRLAIPIRYDDLYRNLEIAELIGTH